MHQNNNVCVVPASMRHRHGSSNSKDVSDVARHWKLSNFAIADLCVVKGHVDRHGASEAKSEFEGGTSFYFEEEIWHEM